MGVRILDHGLIIQRVAFRESSLVLRVLTRKHGKQSFMARGVRKNKRDGHRAALAGFHTVELEGVARSQTAMLVLTRAEIIQARHRLPMQAPALAAAQLLQETVNRLAPDADPCTDFFDLAVSFLDILEAGGHPLVYLSICLGRVIRLLGYGWRLEGCVVCGRLDGLAFFSIKRQQVVCASCGVPHAIRLLPLTPEVLAVMHCLDWPDAPHVFSLHDAGLLYRIAVNSLAQIAGGVLLTDEPFRAMMTAGFGQISTLYPQETFNDRQRAFGNFGLSSMQGGADFGFQKRGAGLPR